ncbi:glycosyl hydrolase, glucoamylase [Planoprotostelium fungivorum]|uniref:Glycosyl hydrolase, glucoamylase n=1 Tax=Planoprotostelium fungivorum TaxID=1890364 RepID=A0A2P6N168_9EUKA|nr:glycosyl hydrolase, glucoamylase [Planoprotostelium fungivorum]
MDESKQIRKKADNNYLPIEGHGLIGNMRTCALVGINGSIDWYCYPHFDSPSVFASILDHEKGGHWTIEPADVPKSEVRNKQFYWPETNILVTRFLDDGEPSIRSASMLINLPDGVGQIVDYMPKFSTKYGEKLVPNSEVVSYSLIRKVQVIRGHMNFRMRCIPAFDFAREGHKLTLEDKKATFKADKGLELTLISSIPLSEMDDKEGLDFTFRLSEGKSCTFYLHSAQHGKFDEKQEMAAVDHEAFYFEETINYWREWLSQCTYKGRWREQVERSALALKLMCFEPTGAIIAAATCGLPEEVGGERNWDYRYTWIRDSAFTVYGFMRIGFIEEAAALMKFMEDRCKDARAAVERGEPPLQIMYGIDGRKDLNEEDLHHLDGYLSSRPVRVGNGAAKQVQMDIYGELMDSVYLYDKYGSGISYEFWNHIVFLLEWLVEHWKDKDQGVWEVRSGDQHFTYSKVMCWIAFDRGIRLANKRSLPADVVKWTYVRNEIYKDIQDNGWCGERQLFSQYYGSEGLDAANLIMPLTFFMAPGDPRIVSTIEATMKTPQEGGLTVNSLVFRYDVKLSDDGLEGEEGTFNICSFWLIEALTRSACGDKKKLAKARLMFEEIIGYENHVGLFAEETGSRGEQLGNFPQAFTHFALISAAFNLNRALGDSSGGH